MTDKTPASYRLFDVRFLASQPHRLQITAGTKASLDELDMRLSDVRICLNSLTEEHFRKTMAAERFDGVMLDVYTVNFKSRLMYIKFHISSEGVDHGILVVSSFKEA